MNTTETPTETPRQIQIHTLIFLLDLSWASGGIFANNAHNMIALINDVLRSRIEIEQNIRLQPDVKIRMMLMQNFERLGETAHALRGIFQRLDYLATVGMGNVTAFREGVEALQRECGCVECLKNAQKNMVDRLGEPGPTPAPEFTGPPLEWIKKIREQRAKAASEQKEESRLIIP